MGSYSPLQDEQERLNKYPRTYSVDSRTRRALDAVAIAPLALISAISLLDLVGLVNNAVTPFDLLALGFFAGIYAFLISRTKVVASASIRADSVLFVLTASAPLSRSAIQTGRQQLFAMSNSTRENVRESPSWPPFFGNVSQGSSTVY
jgi:hypothetical protein